MTQRTTYPAPSASTLNALWAVEAAGIAALLAMSWHGYPPLTLTLLVACVLSVAGFTARLWLIGWDGIPASFVTGAAVVGLCF